MAMPNNFMMLTGHLHSLFKNYIIKGRIRCPKEKELGELIPSFQTGAKTHRRALQSKFRSWAKRMEVENDNLVLASSKKLIIPQEMCDTLIMSLHSKDHVEIEFLIFKIQQKYTWTKKNFGIERETVIRTISKYCHKEECKKDVKVHLCKKSMRPYRTRNPLSVLQPTYLKISKLLRKSKYHAVVFDRRLKKHFTEKISPNNIPSKTSKLNKNLSAPKIHWMRIGGTQISQPIRHSTENENNEKCNNNAVLRLEGPTNKSTVDIKVDDMKTSKHYLLSSLGLVKQGRQNHPVAETSTPACSSGAFEPKNSDCSKYNSSRSYENPQNMREFREMVISAENNPTLYPDILSNPKTKFLSVLGIAPKRIFSKETLSNFEFEIKKKQLMNKPQTFFADRKALRDRNKMYKLSHLYSTEFRKSSLRHDKSLSLMQHKSIQIGGHRKSRENYKRNLDKTSTSFRFPLSLSERDRRQKINEYYRNLNTVPSKIPQVASSYLSEDHSRRYEKIKEMSITRVPDIKNGINAVLIPTMQRNSQRLDDSNISKRLRIKKIDYPHSNPTPLKAPAVIDIVSGSDEECESNKNGSAFENIAKNPLKISIMKEEHPSLKYPKLFSELYERGMPRNQGFNNEDFAFRRIGGVDCCCPPFHSKGSNSQNRSNFDSFNRNHHREHLLAKPFSIRRGYPNTMGMYPPMRFQHRYNPLMPHPYLMNTGQQLRGNLNTHGIQTLKSPADNPKISEGSINEPNRNCNEIASNSSVRKSVIPLSSSKSNFDKNTLSTLSSAPRSSISDASHNSNLPTSISSVDGRYVSQPGVCISSQDEYAKKNLSNMYYNNISFSRSNMIRARNPNGNRFAMNPLESGPTISPPNVLSADARYENMKKASLNRAQFNLFTRSGIMKGVHYQSDTSLPSDVKSNILHRDVVMDGSNKNPNKASLNLPPVNPFSRTNTMTSVSNGNNSTSNISLSGTDLATVYPNVGMGVSQQRMRNTLFKSHVKGLFSRPNILRNAPNHIVKPIAIYPRKNSSIISHPDVGMEAINKNVDKTPLNALGCNFSSRPYTTTSALNRHDNSLTGNSFNKNSIISHSGVCKDVLNENVNSSTTLPFAKPLFSTPNTMKSALNEGENISTIASSDISSTNSCTKISMNASNENAPLKTSRCKLLFPRHNKTNSVPNGSRISSTVKQFETVSFASYPNVGMNAPKEDVFLSNALAAKSSTYGHDVNGNTPNPNLYPGVTNAPKENVSLSNVSDAGLDVSGKTPNQLSNSSGFNSITSRVHIVKCSQNDVVKTFNSSSLNTGSVVQSAEVSMNAPSQCNDFTMVTLDQLKELSKNFKVIVVNQQSRKNNFIVPVYRRIIPNMITHLSSNVGKQSNVEKNVNCPKLLPKPNNIARSTEIPRAKVNKRDYSFTKDAKVDTKDSSKVDIYDEMQTLANWIDKMKSSSNPFRETLQRSMTSLADDLEVGINLIQSIRNTLIDVEKKEELKQCIQKEK